VISGKVFASRVGLASCLLAALWLKPVVEVTAAQRQEESRVVLVGTVIDASTSRPVPGAVVTMETPREGCGSARAPASIPQVESDPGGRFVVDELPPGSYCVSVRATGYLPAGYGQQTDSDSSRPIRMTGGNRIEVISVRVWPAGAIRGAVTDATGGAVVRASVWLLRIAIPDDGHHAESVAQALTDDLGHYAFLDVPAGTYVLVVPMRALSLPSGLQDNGSVAQSEPRALSPAQRLASSGAPLSPTDSRVRVGGADLLVEPAPSRFLVNASSGGGRKVRGLATVYYPSARTLDKAARIVLRSGDDRPGTDIRTDIVDMVTIRGIVRRDGQGEPYCGVHLVPADLAAGRINPQLEAAVTASDARGEFEFPAVPVGEYRIQAWEWPHVSGVPDNMISPTQDAEWTESTLSVEGAASPTVVLDLERGLSVAGRTILELGTGAPQDSKVHLGLAEASGRGLPGPLEQVVTGTADFRLAGYPRGDYYVTVGVESPGWFLKSVTYSGRSILDETIHLAPTDVSGVEVTLSTQRTGFAGTVHATGVNEPEAISVLVVRIVRPSGDGLRLSWRPPITVYPSRQGTLPFVDLLPGEYLVIPMTSMPDQLLVNSATTLSTIPGAIDLNLAPGESKQVALVVGRR
jgi:hypothetical protein